MKDLRIEGITFEQFMRAFIAWEQINESRVERRDAAQQPPARNERGRRSNRRAAKAGRRWTDSDNEEIMRDFAAGLTIAGMARKYGRSERAIRERLHNPERGLLRADQVRPLQMLLD